MFLSLRITCLCIFIHTYLLLSLFWYWYCWCFSVYFFFSLLLSLVAFWHRNKNPLRPKTLFFLGHHLPLTLLLLMYSSVMIKPERTFGELFSTRLSFGTPSHSIRLFRYWPSYCHLCQGWGWLCDIPVTCPSVIIQEFYSNMHEFDTLVSHFFARIRGTRIVVTPDIVSEVLHVPRVAHPDYPSCDRLRTVSKDELSSLFCEKPSSWGDWTPLVTPLLAVVSRWTPR